MRDILSYFLEASIAHVTTATAKTIIALSSTMSDISSLEKQVADLNRGINNWNRVYVWALGFALLAGALSFWAQRQAISRSRELITASNDLSTEKDRQLQLDLKLKDEQIAKTNERAAELEKEAAQLKLLVTWRSLSKEQLETLAKPLSERPSRLRFVTMANDPEAMFFSIQISRAFNGWKLYPSTRSTPGTLVIGLTIIGTSEDEVAFVRSAFTSANISFATNPIPGNSIDITNVSAGNEGEPGVTIIVGSKPRPEFENVAK